LGTLLVIIGVSWMFITHIGMLLLVPAIMFVGLRIKTEEEMLTRHFGEAYISYKKSTKKLIPFVF
jgi:protein-S-isoprenylcysteine O-methyltransferase Ste14